MNVSVIIPALDEEDSIRDSIASAGEAEVIVADGGSSDGTIRAAASSGARVVVSGRGRGLQMDRGAREAAGDVLLFLHADTRLPRDWVLAVTRAIEDEGAVAGGFRLSVGAPGRVYRAIETLVNLRSRFLGLIYGDQALFVRREAFFKAGGFRNLPLMEDVDLVRRLRNSGRTVLLKESVVTSPRRWESRGVFPVTLRNWALLLLYHMGVAPERLYDRYYGKAKWKSAKGAGRGPSGPFP